MIDIHLGRVNDLHAMVEMALMWIGFCVVCGMSAKALLPGRDPGGTIVTLCLGAGGALIGSGVYVLVFGNRVRDLISPLGFTVAILGAMVLLIVHRLLSGRIGGGIPQVVEQVYVPQPQYTRRRRRYADVD